jgi:hypothetical protein
MGILQMRKSSAGHPLTTARATLAEMIAETTAADTRLAELEAIRGRAWSEVREAQDAAAAAQEAAATVARANVEHSTRRLLGDAGPPPMTPAAARLALQDALDAEATASAAYRAIDIELKALSERTESRGMRLDQAAAEVLREEMPDTVRALLADIDALQKQMVDKAQALAWAINRGVVKAFGIDATPGVGEISGRCTTPATSWVVWNRPNASPMTAGWAAAFAALQADASAPGPR